MHKELLDMIVARNYMRNEHILYIFLNQYTDYVVYSVDTLIEKDGHFPAGPLIGAD